MSSKFVPLKGGLDLSTPPVEKYAGTLEEVINFEETPNGGYRSLAGYDYFDGQTSPAEVSYYTSEITGTPGPSWIVGATLTIGSASLLLLYLDTDIAVWYDTTQDPGTLPVVVDGVTVNTFERFGAPSIDEHNQFLTLAQDEARSRLTSITGDGAVVGIGEINGSVLTWRVNASSISCSRSTSNGWIDVPVASLCEISAVANSPAYGDVVGDYTIVGVYDWLPTGSTTPDATRAVLLLAPNIASPTAPTISSSLVRTGDSATLGTVDVFQAYTFATGGHFTCINHNFYGDSGRYRLYAADGVNEPLEYDPTYDVIKPILVNYREPNSTIAKYVIAHNSRLFVATQGGSYLTSKVGVPDVFDGLTGAQEIAVGSEITGFHKVGADDLVITTERITYALTGSTTDTWKLTPVSESSGAYERGVQAMDDVYLLNLRGISSLSRSEKLGGFDAGTISNDIQELLDSYLNSPSFTFIGSLLVKKKNQVRWFFTDGTNTEFIIQSRITYNANGNEGIRYGFTVGKYPVQATCVHEADDGNIYFGGNDGYVYRADFGTSAAGSNMHYLLTLPFNHLGSPMQRKRFREIMLEISAKSNVALTLWYYKNDGRKSYNPKTVEFLGGAARWDESVWDVATFDGYRQYAASQRLLGTGFNIQFALELYSSVAKPFTLTGYTLWYSNRSLTKRISRI